jgi:hypothetical protein
MGFFEQFLEVFSELKGKNFYLSGESVGQVLYYVRSRVLTGCLVCWLLFVSVVFLAILYNS